MVILKGDTTAVIKCGDAWKTVEENSNQHVPQAWLFPLGQYVN